MKYLFFPGVTSVRCQNKSRFAVAAVDERGAKRLKTSKLKNRVIFWDVPLVRGITYCFFGAIAFLQGCFDGLALSGTKLEGGVSENVAGKLNVKKEAVAMTFLLLLSLGISLFLFGFLPSKLSFVFVGMSMNFVLRNFIIALTKIAMFFLILLIFRFLPPMQDLYKFNGAANQVLARDGELKNEIQQYVESHDMSYVKLLGVVQKPEEVLANSKIFFLGSIYEANPMSIWEAMACGCVPIVSDLPGMNEIVSSTEGCLFKVNEVQEATSLVINALANQTKLKEMSKNCREKSLSNSSSYVIEKYMRLLENGRVE